MENQTYGLISQYKCNGRLSDENNPAPWKSYGDPSSVRSSSINGNILIIDDEFYDSIPFLPDTKIIVVTNNSNYVPAEKRVVVTHCLKDALSHDFQDDSERKRFIANSPFLDIERKLVLGWNPDEIFTMRPHEENTRIFLEAPSGWEITSHFIVPKTKDEPCDLVFRHYKKIA